LRYGTYGKNAIEKHASHFSAKTIGCRRNLIVAGNFNMTNNDQLFDQLVDLGPAPKREG
jgi:amidophosphoribosyltransferase